MNLPRLVLSAGLLLVLSWTAFSGDAPPEVATALRDRVQQFYQLQQDRKYREADAFVAEDTKEYYFNARKPTLTSFRIVSIDFAPDLQHATVKLIASAPLPIPGTELHPLEAPVLSEWKLEGGKWFWHFDQEKLLETPFGKVKPLPPSTGLPMVSSTPPPLPPVNTGAPIAAIRAAVQADPGQITLDARHPVTEVIKLKNSLPGPVLIRVFQPAGVDVVLMKENLAANESTELRITPRGTPERPGQINLRADPIGQTMTIPIVWAAEK